MALLITGPSPTSFDTLSVKKEKEKNISDPWHVTHDTRQVTPDMWHVTHDRWGEVYLVSKCQLLTSYGLGVKVFWTYFRKGWLALSLNQSVAKVFVEQPQLHRVCYLYKFQLQSTYSMNTRRGCTLSVPAFSFFGVLWLSLSK